MTTINHELIDNSKEVGKVYYTKDYDKIRNIKGNRTLNKRNYSKLLKSMSEQFLQIPLICSIQDGEIVIIDGQHRFEVAKQLDLGVYYTLVEGYGLDELKRANQVSSVWQKADFLHLFIEEGKEDYIAFQEIMKQYGINIYSLLRIAAVAKNETVNSISYSFEKGTFTLDPMVRIQIEKFFTDLEDFNMFSEYKTKSFVSAFLKLYYHESYDHKMMQNKLKLRASELKRYSNEEGYLDTLCNKIYSYGINSKSIRYVGKKLIAA